MQLKSNADGRLLRFDNGISIQLLEGDSGFEGLGVVKHKRRLLRGREAPILPLVTTPNGHRVVRLEPEGEEREEEALITYFTPSVAATGRQEWVCCDGQDRRDVSPWARPPERDRGGQLRLCLRAVERRLGGIDFTGFSYSYKFRSRRYCAYRIDDRATWEPGGRATGNSFWMAGPFNPPRAYIQNKDSEYTTAWRHDTVPVQQFLPLFTALQGFAFQFDTHGLLVTAFEQPFHCRSLFQKSAGTNCFVHWHQLCTDLGGCIKFPSLQILWAPSEVDDEHERANQYLRVQEALQGEFRRAARIDATPAPASAWMRCAGDASAHDVHTSLDRLSAAGFQRVYVRGLGPDGHHADAGEHVPMPASQFIRHAHERDLGVAVPLAECAAWHTVEDDASVGDAEGRLAEALENPEAYRALLERLEVVHRDYRADAVFLDSLLEALTHDMSWNMGREPAVQSLNERRLDLTAAVQRMGFDCPMAGPLGIGTAVVPRAADIVGSEFMFRDAVVPFNPDSMEDSSMAPWQAFFRACAMRVGYALTWRPGGGEPESHYAACNKAYQAVRSYMEQACILPKGCGVVWSSCEPGITVLWAFREFKHGAGYEADVFDVTASRRMGVEGSEFKALAWHVYLVQSAGNAPSASN